MNIKNMYVILTIGTLFIGCGGGGSDSSSEGGSSSTNESEIKTGYFKDSAVSGLTYSSCPTPLKSCINGITDGDGSFQYKEGDTISFKLGDMVIAQGPAQQLLIPEDVTPDTKSSEKLVQFLVTLDSDNNPKTGINISQNIRENATALKNISFNEIAKDDTKLQELVNSVSVTSKTLISASEAKEHSKLSKRLKLMRLTSLPIQHYLGEKHYNSAKESMYNTDILNSDPNKRLLLGIWQEKRNGFLSKAKEYSDKTTEEEKEKARLDYAISVAKGIFDTTMLLVDPTEVTESTSIKIIGTTVGLASDGVKLGADVDVGNHAQVAQGLLGGFVGIMDASDGKSRTAGFVKGSAKDLVLAGMGYTNTSESYKSAFSTIGWPIVDVLWDNFQGVAFKPNKAEIVADQLEKIARAAVNVRAAIHISSNTSVSDTIHAAMDYLDAFYLSCGNRDFMLEKYDMPIDIQKAYDKLNKKAEATSSWQDWVRFGAPPIEKALFMTYVSEALSDISQSMRTYLDALAPSITNVDATMHSNFPEKICNGTSIMAFIVPENKDEVVMSYSEWFRPRSVLSGDETENENGILNILTFTEAGYFTINAKTHYTVQEQYSGISRTSISTLVEPCMEMTGVGIKTIKSTNDNTSSIKYEVIPADGYTFLAWAKSSDNSIVSTQKELDYSFNDFETRGTLKAVMKQIDNTTTAVIPLTFNGVYYDGVSSPYTGKVWLDRDIGASKKCESYNESECIGTPLEWETPLDQLTGDPKTDAQITSANMQNLTGSGICPQGFRLPTKEEFLIETAAQGVKTKEDAYNNFLKIAYDETNYINKYWTSAYEETETNAYPITILNTDNNFRDGSSSRTQKYRIRCISDTIGTNSIPFLADNINLHTVLETSISKQLPQKDVDGDTLTYEIITEPSHGTVTLNENTITYSAVGDFTGVDNFTVRAYDGKAYSNIQTIQLFVYGELSSPSGATWLDRNLGAKKVCSNKTEWDCFGYYYQWGRGNDGHEDYKRKQIGSFVSVLSVSTTHKARTLDSAGDRYIITPNGVWKDWMQDDLFGEQRSKRWAQETDNPVCPIGYRLPNIAELEAEKEYIDLLNIPYGGSRFNYVNSVYGVGEYGFIWSSEGNISGYTTKAYGLYLDENNASIKSRTFSEGLNIRCIKN